MREVVNETKKMHAWREYKGNRKGEFTKNNT